MNILKQVLVLLASMTLIACSSMHTMNVSRDSDRLKRDLRIGSIVSLTTVGGQSVYKKKVTSIGEADFTVADATIAYNEVQHIEVSQFSGNKTAGLALLLFVLHQLSSAADGDPGVDVSP